MAARKKRPTTKFIETIRRLARRSWKDLRHSEQLDLSLSEESITDYLVLALVRKHGDLIAVQKYTKQEQGSTTGADWEWWFGGKSGWMGLRVQAKKLRDGRYSHLEHKVKGTRKKRYNLLISNAVKFDLYPIYCFYNYWPDRSIRLGLPKPHLGQRPLQGWSVADAYAVKKLAQKGKVALANIAPISMPAEYLFLGALGHPRKDIPARVFDSVSEMAGRNGQSKHRPIVMTDPPEYIYNLWDSRFDVSPQRRINLLSDRSDIDGILILNAGGAETESAK